MPLTKAPFARLHKAGATWQIRTRDSVKDEWPDLDEDGVFLVEAAVTGEQLKPLVSEIDEWADTFEQMGATLATSQRVLAAPPPPKPSPR